MNKKISLILIASLATLALSGCSTDGNILEPEVEITFANQEGSSAPTEVKVLEPEDIAVTPEITIAVNGIVAIGLAGSEDFLLWEGTSSDESIVKFFPATLEGIVSSSAYFEGVKTGSAEVTINNTATGEIIKTKIIVQ